MAKTGVTAHLQAGVVARILMGGEDAKNTGRTNCPFDLGGYGLGTFVIGDYYSPPVVKYPPRTR